MRTRRPGRRLLSALAAGWICPSWEDRPGPVRVQKSVGMTARVERHDGPTMLEYLLLLLSLARSAVRDRDALVTENLLLRQQLAVLTRPTRRRPRLRGRDKLFWV